MITVRCRPIDQWIGYRISHYEQRRAPYGALWATIQDELERELEHLDASDVVIGIDVASYQIRVDGWPKGNVSVPPAVVLSFDSAQGPLRFQCDRWDHWQHNLRAIGLTLQRLRLVDEGGVARSGQQYRGWSELPTAREAGPAAMTVEAAAAFIAEACDDPNLGGFEVLQTWPEAGDRFYRQAAKRLHPDHGGDPAMFRRLTEARDLLAAQQ